METAIAVLLISTLTTTGLLALGAATSRRHWFLRTAAFLGVLSPLLLVPAYEPFVALALQGAVVALGVVVGRWAPSRKRPKQLEGATATGGGPQWRFSMATLLLTMVLCGVAAAVASHAPRLNRYAWQSVALIGVSGGAATLLGYWAATRASWSRRLVASGAAVLLAWLLGGGVQRIDWFAPTMTDSSYAWPPYDDPAMAALFVGDELPPTWFIVIPSSVAITLVAVLVINALGRALGRRMHDRVGAFRARAATLGVVAITVLVAAPATVALYRLLTPDPVLIEPAPTPNGFDQLMAAGRVLEGMTINNGAFDASQATTPQLAAAVAEVGPAIQRCRKALTLPSSRVLDYGYDEKAVAKFLEPIASLRSLGRAFDAKGRLMAANGEWEESATTYMDAARLGVAGRRGALIVDGLVGCAITNTGFRGLFEIHEQLPTAVCDRLARQLLSLQSQCEAYELLERRDDVWDQHALGWHGRLYHVLEHLGGETVLGAYEFSFLKESAQFRLLSARLSLQAYRAEQGRLPDSWDEVVATGRPALPADPWSSNGGALRCRRTDDGYLLYSVGPNNVDDGGAPPEGDFPVRVETGDFSLEALYSP